MSVIRSQIFQGEIQRGKKNTDGQNVSAWKQRLDMTHSEEGLAEGAAQYYTTIDFLMGPCQGSGPDAWM